MNQRSRTTMLAAAATATAAAVSINNKDGSQSGNKGSSSSSMFFVSARIGVSSSRNLRRAAPQEGVGFDPTAPSNSFGMEFSEPLRNTNKIEDESLRLKNYHQEEDDIQERRNSNNRTDTASSPPPEEQPPSPVVINSIDTGVLPNKKKGSKKPDTRASSPSGTPSTKHHSQCRMGKLTDKTLIPAEQFIRENPPTSGSYGSIVFDPQSQSVVCGDDNFCQELHFEDCSEVTCNGDKSCYNSRIHNAERVECNGTQSCAKAHIDSTSVSCTARQACAKSFVADTQLAYEVHCAAHESCAWMTVSQAEDVHCVGPAACYGATFSNIGSSLYCQSLPHKAGFYSPTCGGDESFVEAAPDRSITVTCSGDFACIGYGAVDDDSDHPAYFEVDVGGPEGELLCEHSSLHHGNRDGGTYVCRYIDIHQGCAQYTCVEPDYYNEDQDYKTCNHIFSVPHKEICYYGPTRDEDGNNDVNGDWWESNDYHSGVNPEFFADNDDDEVTTASQ